MSVFAAKTPKVVQPTPVPAAANPASTPEAASAGGTDTSGLAGFSSLVSTSTQGLTRKANTVKASLIGGA